MDPSRVASIVEPHAKAEPLLPKPLTIDVCDYTQSNCSTFEKIDNQIIKMVNRHYYDLQMYANYVFAIDNNITELQPSHNFSTQVSRVKAEHGDNDHGELFNPKQMEALRRLTDKMLHKLRANWITAAKYTSELTDMTYFAAGAASPTILVKADKKTIKGLMPIIIKIVPLEFPHHIKHLTQPDANQPGAFVRFNPKQLDTFVQTYINAPSYALFLKEAWMYCFSKTRLSQYVPTFTCIANCYLVAGLPISNVQELKDSFKTFAQQRVVRNAAVPYKKWFDILTRSNDPAVIQSIIDAKYGVFEMGQIEGTWKDMMSESGSFNLGMIFEYLYTKLVAAFVGRIIFTDDHLENMGYRTVDYARAYRIKCNGCIYNYYVQSTKLIQHIDLERYVFNFSPRDIYSNRSLREIPSSAFVHTKGLDAVRDRYAYNSDIVDKGVNQLLSLAVKIFKNENEYEIAHKLLTNLLVYDIRTFCRVMDATLPKSYLSPPTGMRVVEYYLDLDDDRLRVINADMVYENV
ncbi:Hypothetical protein MVR_LOCUS228 [uncultured virus]|nr:Hypothetical protein MVR_LOCUS228 [uncultured virus]